MQAAHGDNASVVEPAVASSSPIAPRVTRTVVQGADGDGLGLVLVNAADVGRALVELDGVDRAGGGRLRVLPAAAPPPNPSELIASTCMKSVVES
jgi:hypothetical protein